MTAYSHPAAASVAGCGVNTIILTHDKDMMKHGKYSFDGDEILWEHLAKSGISKPSITRHNVNDYYTTVLNKTIVDYEPFECRFSFGTYLIKGNPDEIIRIIRNHAVLDISERDMIDILSPVAVNYVSSYYHESGDYENRMYSAIVVMEDFLRDYVDSYNSILVYLWSPKEKCVTSEEIKELVAFIEKFPNTVNVMFGVGIDDSLSDNIKMTLIASSK